MFISIRFKHAFFVYKSFINSIEIRNEYSLQQKDLFKM